MKLLLFCLLGQLFQSQPGRSYQVYDVECTPQGTYICGSFRNSFAGPATQEPAWSDAFLLKLDGQGRLLWEKHLHTEGGDYLSQVASDGQGGVYLAGSLSGHFADCWNGRPSLDWNGPTFVAHLDAQDQLTAHQELLCSASPDGGEPWLKTYDLQFRGGQLALAGSFQGRLGSLVSSQAQSFVASWTTFPGPANWSSLAYPGDGLDFRLQPDPPFQLQVPTLPNIEGVRQQLHWRGGNWAIATVRAGLDSRGRDDAQLWRQDGPCWVSALRWGTSGNDRYEFLRTLDQDLVMVGTSQGALPGQLPSSGDEDRLVWVRLDQPPGPSAAALLGHYSHQQRQSDLAASLRRSRIREVEFEHVVGWTDLGPIVTTPGAGFDGWVQFSFEGQELSRWDPVPTQSPPLLPNIEPYLAGTRLFANYPPGRIATFTGSRLQRIAHANPVHLMSAAESMAHHSWWSGWERGRNGRYRVVLGKVDEMGHSEWVRALGGWEEEESCLSLAWSPSGLALLGSRHLTTLDHSGRVLRQQKLRPAEASGVVWNQGWNYVRQTSQGFRWEPAGLALDPRLARVDEIAFQEGRLYVVGQSKGARGCLLTVTADHQQSWMELPLDESLIHSLRLSKEGIWLGGEWQLDGVCRSFWGRYESR